MSANGYLICTGVLILVCLALAAEAARNLWLCRHRRDHRLTESLINGRAVR